MRIFLFCLPVVFVSFAMAQQTTFDGPAVIPEWERAAGVFVSFPFKLPDQLLKDFANDTKLYVLIEKPNRDMAIEKLGELKIRADQFALIDCSVKSQWPRDWGPHQVRDSQGKQGIVDPDFDGYPAYRQAGGEPVYTYRPGKGDDKVNEEIGQYFELAVDHCPAYLTGGNFLVDGLGTAFCTEAILQENKDKYSRDELAKLLSAELGIERLIILKNTETIGIQHIDCWMKVLDPETLLIKKAPSGHFDEKFLEQNVEALSKLKSPFGRPYKIIRIHCPRVKLARSFREADPIAAYTNSLILNDKVYVPLFGCEGDKAALETWRKALPGYTVKGYRYESWMDFDALHCRSRALFAKDLLDLKHIPIRGTVDYSPTGYEVKAIPRSTNKSGQVIGRLFFRKAGNESWTERVMEKSKQNALTGTINLDAPQTKVQYYLEMEGDGDRQSFPSIAPKNFYEFKIDKK